MLGASLGFELYLPEPTWKAMTAHSSGMTSALLDDKVHAKVNAMIESWRVSSSGMCEG
jgi:hypothetical protein